MIKVDEKWLDNSTGKYICPHCSKQYTKNGICTHIWRAHGDGKVHKPAKDTKPWNKGLTESDDRVLKGKLKRQETIKEVGNYWTGKKHSPETIAKMKANPNQGGAGRGGGIGKQGWYKGYWCDSSWELAYVIYNLEHNIKFKRNTEKFEYEFEGITYNYVPDFIVNDEYVEIKGYVTEQWLAKQKHFTLPLKVLYKDDMKQYIKYTEEKYGKDFVDLYEQKHT